jgi:hypothetical protein
MDRYGNKFYENMEEELPCELDTAHVENLGRRLTLNASEDTMGGLQGP